MTQTWCAIPVYNNAGTIADVARRCRELIAKVVVIDDGSTDADLRILLKVLDVVVVRHSANLGKGAALLTAFRYAADHGGEYLITLDGDGQHFPDDLPHFLSRLSPDAILIGSRDKIVGVMPRSSRFGREFSDLWICIETGVIVRDSQSGFRAYPVRHVLNLRLNSRHYNLEMEVITRAVWAGLRIESVPIRVWYPDRSERVSSFRPFLDNLRISLLHTRLALRNLLPIPHRRFPHTPALPKQTVAQRLNRFREENSTPLGLAAAAALGILLGIVLWPWGPIAVLYLAWRLHLNKAAMFATVALCAPPALPALCLRVGQCVFRLPDRPHMTWFIGSHIVAFAAAPSVALLVYAGARTFRAYRIAESLRNPR